MSERFFTIEEAAGLLAVSASTVKRRIRARDLAVFRDGRIVRVRESDLRRYVAAKVLSVRQVRDVPRPMAARPRRPRTRLWE